jgi:predicted GNAT family N-acyltransferase
MLGQRSDNDIARVEQDGFQLVRRELNQAQSSEQEYSFDSQQRLTDFLKLAGFRSKRIQ